MEYTTRLKWVGCRNGSRSYGWVYLSDEACRWIGVRAGDRLKVVTCEYGGVRFLMILPEGDGHEEKKV